MVGALPFAAGPAKGKVVYGWYDGDTSHLAVIAADDGEARTIVERSGSIFHAAATSASSPSVFVLVLDAASREPVTIERVDIETGDTSVVTSLAPDPVPRPQTVLRLLTAPDDRIVLVDCPTDSRCEVSVIDGDDGAILVRFPTVSGDLVGVIGGLLLIDGGCSHPCGLAAYSLTTGGFGRLGTSCGGAVLATLLGERVVVTPESQGGRCPRPKRLAAFDGHGDVAAPGIALSDNSRDLVVFDDATGGVAVPPNRVLLAPHGLIPTGDERGGVGAALLNLATGQITAVDPLAGSGLESPSPRGSASP